MAQIDIVLATYNGATYLAEQIDSIVDQTYTDWHLIVRDDGSDDDTAAILEKYRARLAGQMTVLCDSDQRLGHVQNFARTLEKSHAPYVAFCDQDDVWIPEKLQRSLGELQRLERYADPESPALVFTDAVVVDARLATIENSFWASEGMHPDNALRLGRMLYGNVVAGNTTLINGALRDQALPVPPIVRNFDWWVALIASAIGTTSFLYEPTVLYRQHGTNAIGAKGFRMTFWDRGVTFVRNRMHRLDTWQIRFEQAEALSSRSSESIAPDAARTLETFLELPDMDLITRLRRARRHELLPRGPVRSIISLSGLPRSEHPSTASDGGRPIER